MRQAPRGGPLKPRVEAERAARHDTFNALPAPAPVRDIWQGGAREATLGVDELAGAQGEEHDAKEVRGPRRQAADEVVNSVGRQIHWRGSQAKRCMVRLGHPTSLAESGCFSLLNW